MDSTYDIEPKQKPKWYQFRWQLACIFVRIARWIYPESPEVKAFLLKIMMDSRITGKFVNGVDWDEMGIGA